MTVGTASPIQVARWHGGQHPTLEGIMRRMREENLSPYVWSSPPNFRYPVRSHGYDKTLYCVRGTLEMTFAHSRQCLILRAGDRVDLPRGVRYQMIIGPEGAQCVEGSYA